MSLSNTPPSSLPKSLMSLQMSPLSDSSPHSLHSHLDTWFAPPSPTNLAPPSLPLSPVFSLLEQHHSPVRAVPLVELNDHPHTAHNDLLLALGDLLDADPPTIDLCPPVFDNSEQPQLEKLAVSDLPQVSIHSLSQSDSTSTSTTHLSPVPPPTPTTVKHVQTSAKLSPPPPASHPTNAPKSPLPPKSTTAQSSSKAQNLQKRPSPPPVDIAPRKRARPATNPPTLAPKSKSQSSSHQATTAPPLSAPSDLPARPSSRNQRRPAAEKRKTPVDDDRLIPVSDKCIRCSIAAKETPMMRKGPDGNRSLCNACGLRWSRHGVY